MDIVVLDGYCLNHGDLSWAPFERLGNVVVYERTPYGEIASRMGGASVMITNKCNVDRTVVDALPNLKYVGVLATGYNNVDTEYCREKGIAVTNVPSYSTESVVQAVFGLTLQLYSGLSTHAASVKRGDWCAAPDFCYYLGSLRELYGKTLGIVGFGAIGRRVAAVGAAFGMRVLVNTRTPSKFPEEGFKYVSFEELMKESDVVSLNCPLTDENVGMINKRSISLMKNNAIIVNTARGGLINDADLAEALNTGAIAGAALDVLSTEPPDASDPLLSARNAFITPHIAWATVEARSRLMECAAANLAAFLEGRELNRV